MSDDQDTIEKIALSWWARLQPDSKNGRKGETGTLARLRRANVVAAAIEPETVSLYRQLAPRLKEFNLKGEEALTRCALIAAVLAHVREHENQPVARALGGNKEEGALMSPLRFRRLLTTRGDSDLLIAFRRVAALLKKKGSVVTANIGDIARSLAEWDDGPRGDRRRMRWAFHYHNAGDAAPDDKTADAA